MPVQRKLMIPVVRALMEEHTHFPNDHLYNEAAMQITSASSLQQLRQGAMNLYTTATSLLHTPPPSLEISLMDC